MNRRHFLLFLVVLCFGCIVGSQAQAYYCPERFISPDPLGHAASMSLYNYCEDPVNGLDPTGRCLSSFKGGESTPYAGSASGDALAGFSGNYPATVQRGMIETANAYQQDYIAAEPMRNRVSGLFQTAGAAFALSLAPWTGGATGILATGILADQAATGIKNTAMGTNSPTQVSLELQRTFGDTGARYAEFALMGITGKPQAGGATGVLRNVVQFEGMEVRAVRSLSHIDTGTLEAMKQYGFAGTTKSGESIVLHHLEQKAAGPLVEIPAGNHSIWNSVQHPLGNTAGVGLSEAERGAYNAWRTEYWKWRATQELNLRQSAGN